MTQLVLDDDQAKAVQDSRQRIRVCDRHGNVLGFVIRSKVSAADIAIAKQRRDSAQPRLSTQQVLDHLKSLEQQQ